MALFGRRKRHADRPGTPPADPDPALPVLSRDDALTLDRLARETFAARGVEVTSDGAGQLTAMDGMVYGLTNLSARVAAEPQSLDEVRHQVYPRLRWAADLPELPSYAASPLPGVVELAALDYPTHVAEMFGDEAVAQLGGWAAIRAQGMVNLRALDPMHHETIPADAGRDDADVHVLTSDDFFGPSRVLVLDDVMVGLCIPASPHGVLVVVPNRHLLALHPVRGPGVVAAVQLLARISTGECDTQPGPLSPHVYFLPPAGAPAEQVTRVEDDGTLMVRVDGAFAQAFARLGLLEG